MFNHLFTVLAISETWEVAHNLVYFSIPGYSIVSIPRNNDVKCRGVQLHCMYVMILSLTCVYLETLVLNVCLSKQSLLLSNSILLDVFTGHHIRICAHSMKILIVYCTKLAPKRPNSF